MLILIKIKVMFLKKIFYVLLICLIVLVGCSKKEDEDVERDKVIVEISHFSSELLDMLNALNNISLQNYELVSEEVSNNSQSGNSNQSTSQTESKSSMQNSESANNEEKVTVTQIKNVSTLNINNDEIDWEILKQKIENLNVLWSVMMLDLYKLDANKEEIIDFGNLLNQAILSIKSEDKIGTLTNLSALYSYMPRFIKIGSEDNAIQNIESTKYYIIVSYISASLGDWNNVGENLLNAENSFLNVLNDTEYYGKKETMINKTYMLIKDLQTATLNNDKTLFFLKYKNLMENINML